MRLCSGVRENSGIAAAILRVELRVGGMGESRRRLCSGVIVVQGAGVCVGGAGGGRHVFMGLQCSSAGGGVGGWGHSFVACLKSVGR